MTIESIALDKLYISPANVRKTGTKDGIEGLANSIHVHGLLQNLTVQPGGEADTFSVLAGGRRLMALQLLAKQKKLPGNWPVPCNLIEIEGDIPSEEISLAENIVRVAMHPADQFEAFKKLVDEGQGEETIAAKFGVTPHVVRQRLKLAVVSPKLIKAYRDDEMTLEQLMAFTIGGSDHKQQEKVWKELPAWAKENDDERPIRRAFTNKHIPSDNDTAAFVGIEAYEAAGGQVLRDLFSDDDRPQAYFANAALLDKLAGEKLEQIAETVRAEGWKWVIVIPDLTWEEERKYMRRDVKHSHTPEQKAEAAKLQKEIVALEKQQEALDEFDTDLDEKIDALRDRLDAAEKGTAVWTAKDRELAGAIITIDEGKAGIKRGLMKAEEARAAKKAESTKSKTKSKGDADDKSELSQALHREITAQRTAAIRAKLSRNPKIALAAVVHSLIADAIYNGDMSGMLNIRIELTPLEIHAKGIDKSKASKEEKAAREAAGKKLPESA